MKNLNMKTLSRALEDSTRDIERKREIAERHARKIAHMMKRRAFAQLIMKAK